ncbi:MAG TPA: GntR family transcriptional regulator [Nitrospirota bacterium]|nr:GntR family transcriptional regulator [Nitrospirota bacterium]
MWNEKTVDRDSQQKLYVQMYAIIKDKIESGEWPHGSQIPTEDELCKVYNVSKATVRMAVSELVRSGFLKKLQGKGTFVTHQPHLTGLAMKTKLTENMFGEGVSVTKEVVRKEIRTSSVDIEQIFQGMHKQDGKPDIFYMLCKRSVNGEPAYIEETYVPLVVMPDIDQEDVSSTPLYDLIQEKSEHKITKVVQTIEVADIDAKTAQLLGSSAGGPGLLLHRFLIGSDAGLVAYTRLHGMGKKYKIQIEFERLK